ETDLGVGYRQAVRQREGHTSCDGGDFREAAVVAVREVGVITAQKFIGAFAAQGDRDVRATHAGKEPHGQSAGVGARLVGVISHFFDGAGEVQGRVEVELVVFGSVVFGNAVGVTALVELAAAERDGKGFQRL